MNKSTSVEVRRETVVLPTYEPQRPDPNPMFLEKRVYQGSSGRVYPLPFTDRVAEKPEPRAWDAVYLENEYARVMLLPALGGRIHRIQDKTNNYDAIYHQPVIKPALVALAGPWCSGGIEFNWPQHHRPSTFMPTDVAIEHHPDGSATVWMSEHDPMARMKGMHGVCLHPGKSHIELKVRVYNRTPDVRTFLWWANAATRVHEAYQSFFPADVTHVADHARRAMSTFPLSRGRYYGVDYAARARGGVPPDEQPRLYRPEPQPSAKGRSKPADALSDPPTARPDDLSWYVNIPVPTSYMCMGSSEDFVGGYDYKARAGLIHVANHHIAPGKKQWTWGNHEFGYTWDRNLTDAGESGEFRPYIELMAGVYTDNQPDFSFLQPGETRTWSQFWYPIREIGPAQHATTEAAISLRRAKGRARVGVAVTAVHADACVQLELRGRLVAKWPGTLAPDRPLVVETAVAARAPDTALTVRVLTADGRELAAHTPKAVTRGEAPPPATEPPAPADVVSVDELYITGLHLEQYRHATRMPETYWREGLRRDPGDARCNLAMGRWHMRRGEFAEAEICLRASIARLTLRNANPCDGEPHYQLGLCLRHQAFAAATRGEAAIASVKFEAAYAAFHKAAWNQAWQGAAHHALAEIDISRGKWETALDHLARALRVNADNLRARNLQAIVLRQLGRVADADAILRETLALDPLDWWARHLNGEAIACDNQVRFDLALDCARAGLFADARGILEGATASRAASRLAPEAGVPRADLFDASLGTGPLIHYYRAWLAHLAGDRSQARRSLAAAAKADPAYCFPARVEEITILEFALANNPGDARAPFLLGNLLYDRRRHDEAIRLWERAVKGDPGNAVAWRNLGIGYFNVRHQPARARASYERAFRANSADARLLYERDQLWKRLGVSPARRLHELLRHAGLVRQRDDLSVELCALYNQTGQPEAARAVLTSRRFQPLEGGEGQALGQHARAHLALGRRALAAGQPVEALAFFRAALAAPENLGEAKHPLANQSDIYYWLGRAHAACGDEASAREMWTIASKARGDFQEMSVRTFSEMTYYSALALERLGRASSARRLLRELLAHARALARSPATIDYFATSLPTMLLFDDDLQARQKTTALSLEAQARLGLGQAAAARRLLRMVLQRDPSHALAADLPA